MLSFNQLTCTINGTPLFNNLSLTLLPFSITYLQGANGCGKTSLLRIIAGIQKPTKGHIYLGSRPGIVIDNIKKPYCTYIGHNFGLKSELTIFENLKFWSSIYNSLEALEASIHYFKLGDILSKKYYQLSAGNQKKVALSTLLSCQSDLWLLDEVESNLDQENRSLLHNLIISKANNGGIVLMTSHEQPAIKTAQILKLEDYQI